MLKKSHCGTKRRRVAYSTFALLAKLEMFERTYTVAAHVLGQVGLSPTKNLPLMFSKAACFLATTVFFLSTILVSVIFQTSISRWLGLGMRRLIKQTIPRNIALQP